MRDYKAFPGHNLGFSPSEVSARIIKANHDSPATLCAVGAVGDNNLTISICGVRKELRALPASDIFENPKP